jgi:hypothetical protein
LWGNEFLLSENKVLVGLRLVARSGMGPLRDSKHVGADGSFRRNRANTAMEAGMKRRELITLLGGAAIAWPSGLRAQESAMPIIGIRSAGTPEADTKFMKAFWAGLGDAGYTEGRNVTFVQRWARSELERLPELVADLVSLRVAVIVTLSCRDRHSVPRPPPPTRVARVATLAACPLF